MTKKNICGIVAEYNPFHNGHQYHIQQARISTQADLVIAVMSGNWVQRGEPAIIDKWTRANVAVKNGVDLVVELPYAFATQSASQFAHGAITLLKELGITRLAFGSECANLDNLIEIANTSISPNNIQEMMQEGTSYPKAYSLLTTQMLPNDILAICYLKEIQGTNITPVLIPRTSSYTSDALDDICSAYAIRNALRKKQSIIGTTPMEEVLVNEPLHFIGQYYPYFRTLLLTSSKTHLQQTFLINEGIENHLFKQAEKNETWDGFLNDATSWRYTASRIRRSVVQILNQIQKEDINQLPPLTTIRTLAMNNNGRAYLHDIKKSDIQIANRFAEIPTGYREMEYKTTMLYASTLDEQKRNELLKKELGGPILIP